MLTSFTGVLSIEIIIMTSGDGEKKKDVDRDTIFLLLIKIFWT